MASLESYFRYNNTAYENLIGDEKDLMDKFINKIKEGGKEDIVLFFGSDCVLSVKDNMPGSHFEFNSTFNSSDLDKRLIEIWVKL